jgi:hypothetical protein
MLAYSRVDEVSQLNGKYGFGKSVLEKIEVVIACML